MGLPEIPRTIVDGSYCVIAVRSHERDGVLNHTQLDSVNNVLRLTTNKHQNFTGFHITISYTPLFLSSFTISFPAHAYA